MTRYNSIAVFLFLFLIITSSVVYSAGITPSPQIGIQERVELEKIKSNSNTLKLDGNVPIFMSENGFVRINGGSYLKEDNVSIGKGIIAVQGYKKGMAEVTLYTGMPNTPFSIKTYDGITSDKRKVRTEGEILYNMIYSDENGYLTYLTTHFSTQIADFPNPLTHNAGGETTTYYLDYFFEDYDFVESDGDGITEYGGSTINRSASETDPEYEDSLVDVYFQVYYSNPRWKLTSKNYTDGFSKTVYIRARDIVSNNTYVEDSFEWVLEASVPAGPSVSNPLPNFTMYQQDDITIFLNDYFIDYDSACIFLLGGAKSLTTCADMTLFDHGENLTDEIFVDIDGLGDDIGLHVFSNSTDVTYEGFVVVYGYNNSYSQQNFSITISGVAPNGSGGDNTGIGGTITNFTNSSGTFIVHTFTTSDTLQLFGSTTADVLVVAGGGGGGGTLAGNGGAAGGGAGGYRYSRFTLPQGNYSVVVGAAGGLGPSATDGGYGGNSSFNGTWFRATGGGGGSRANGGGNPGLSGGSGGGSYYLGTPGAGNVGGYNPVEGYNGSTGCNSGAPYFGGGGGGSSQKGVTAVCPTQPGDGGNGTTNSINGSVVYYAGGGGGGVGASYSGSAGVGGRGGGGNGGNATQAGQNATGYGSGGGGGSAESAGTYSGGRGSQGVVIVTYEYVPASYDTPNQIANIPNIDMEYDELIFVDFDDFFTGYDSINITFLDNASVTRSIKASISTSEMSFNSSYLDLVINGDNFDINLYITAKFADFTTTLNITAYNHTSGISDTSVLTIGAPVIEPIPPTKINNIDNIDMLPNETETLNFGAYFTNYETILLNFIDPSDNSSHEIETDIGGASSNYDTTNIFILLQSVGSNVNGTITGTNETFYIVLTAIARNAFGEVNDSFSVNLEYPAPEPAPEPPALTGYFSTVAGVFPDANDLTFKQRIIAIVLILAAFIIGGAFINNKVGTDSSIIIILMGCIGFILTIGLGYMPLGLVLAVLGVFAVLFVIKNVNGGEK